MKHFILVTLFAITSQTVSLAQAHRSPKLDGKELLKDCVAAVKILDSAKTQNLRGSTICFVYIKGFTDGIVALAAANPNDRYSFVCPDAELTNDQTVRVVTKYLSEHPEELYKQARVLVSVALVHAFPCPAQKVTAKPPANQ